MKYPIFVCVFLAFPVALGGIDDWLQEGQKGTRNVLTIVTTGGIEITRSSQGVSQRVTKGNGSLLDLNLKAGMDNEAFLSLVLTRCTIESCTVGEFLSR